MSPAPHLASSGSPQSGATWEIREGDALDRLREMPDESVHCCVTSPPYFGLRDYGVDGQIGLETTPGEFVARLIAVFAEVRRVLRADGTLWLNVGDSYAGSWGAQSGPREGISSTSIVASPKRTRTGSIPAGANYKAKDLMMIPAQLALALRADGWWLRSDIIWAKTTAMPESVTDRPTSSHEHIFLLARSARYYYDAAAIREPDSGADYPRSVLNGQPSLDPSGGLMAPHRGLRSSDGRDGMGANKRNVWTVSQQPYAAAHFATFPPKLIEPCILAGTPALACASCAAPWMASAGDRGMDLSRPQAARRAVRIAEDKGLTEDHIAAIRACGVTDVGRAKATQNGAGRNNPEVQALADEAKAALGGYYREFLLVRTERGVEQPSCECGTAAVPGVVLDPFAGAATTGVVALRHGRSFIGIELNPDYCELGRRRIVADAPLLNQPAENVA